MRLPRYPTLLSSVLSCLSCALLVGACAGEEDSQPTCTGSKCDDPNITANDQCAEMCGSQSGACFDECRRDEALGHCEARKSDALSSAQQAFTRDAIRWAAADVEGVDTNNRDDRGQEYVEYYAIVAPPPLMEGGEAPAAVALGQTPSSPLSVEEALQERGDLGAGAELPEDAIFALEDHPDAVVGQCIFTSWHADVNGELPVCAAQGGECPEFALPEDASLTPWLESTGLGIRMTAENTRMKNGVNSNNAAADLVDACLGEVTPGDPEDSADPLHDNYVRGCMKAYELFTTEWRRSDSAVCVAGMRLNECGCGVDSDGDGAIDIDTQELGDIVEDDEGRPYRKLARALIPRQPESPTEDDGITFRGFPLGTWSDEHGLPAGCRYLETGDPDPRHVVSCDMTATDLLSSLGDPKGLCREKYGDNVVAHVPLPGDAIVCEPPEAGQYAETCGDMPWVEIE